MQLFDTTFSRKFDNAFQTKFAGKIEFKVNILVSMDCQKKAKIHNFQECSKYESMDLTGQ